jgi:Holliday junction DNA helicase RuvA
MITKITGKLLDVQPEKVTLGVEAFEYEVLIPEYNRRLLQGKLGEDISLFTIEYLEGNQMSSRFTPRLIGFLHAVEREFFDLFCSVDGVGVKKALRAMVRPVQEVATCIEDQDTKSLSALPGIGPATAERIIAKLRRKVPKYALLVSREVNYAADVTSDVVTETFDALRTLGHSESDARRLIDAVLARKKKFKDTGELLAAVYDQSKE